MIRFILNDQLIEANLPGGSSLLDYIRYRADLPGTKIGCREGDCGACTVLEGRLQDNQLVYHSIVSCLTPLGNAEGRHIVTVEGIWTGKPNPVQQAFVDHGGTQCGFCTPGFVMSLHGHAMQAAASNPESAIASVSGNICRCTGYKSIERSAAAISRQLREKNPDNPLEWLVGHGWLPEYFRQIPGRLREIQIPGHKHQNPQPGNKEASFDGDNGNRKMPWLIAGGTDLMVQRPEELEKLSPVRLAELPGTKSILFDESDVWIGAGVVAEEIMQHERLQKLIPGWKDYFRLVSSEPIRNMGTLGGNLVNASPIGDLSIMFLALDARLRIKSLQNDAERELPLRDFFTDYRQTDLKPGEYIESLGISCRMPAPGFHFEKLSKRTHLDIASVNSAMVLHMESDTVVRCDIAMGGLAAIPLYLNKTSAFFSGKPISKTLIAEGMEIMQQEIRPISDIRGSTHYKRLLARQQLLAHFLYLLPSRFTLDELIAKA